MSEQESAQFSTDALLRQATCAVMGGAGNASAIATAWLASGQGHLVTAGHTFTNKRGQQTIEVGDPVFVRFIDDERALETHLTQLVFDRSRGLDFAILKLLVPAENRLPLPFMLVQEVEGNFLLRGYGKNLPNAQSGGKGIVVGTYLRAGSSDNVLFQLRSQELAHEGYSGGAVFSEELGAAVAIQTEATQGTTNILAMPLYRIPEYWEEIERLATPLYRGTCVVIAPDARVNKLAYGIVQPLVGQKLKFKVEVVIASDDVYEDDLRKVEQAELVIADVTGADPIVIYELTVAQGIGTPDIVVGEQLNGEDYAKMPFDVTPIKLEEVERAREILEPLLSSPVTVVETLRAKHTNAITKFFRAPLTQLSPAYGLALGYYHNFIKPVGQVLYQLSEGQGGLVKVNGESIPTGEPKSGKPDKLYLDILIPKKLEWATHGFIKEQMTNRGIPEAIVEGAGSSRKFFLRAMPWTKGDEIIHLLDVFPTTMSVIIEAIDQRLEVKHDRTLEVTAPKRKQRLRTRAWKEIEEKEIDRFKSSLIREIENETDFEIGRVVNVKNWNEVFPDLGSNF